MRKILMRVAVGAVAFALVSSAAFAQNIEEVKVEASRIVSKINTRESLARAPIRVNDISLSYAVSVADLDLASSAGAGEAEKRVTNAAETACKEISRQYPEATPNDADCAKAAVEKAMIKVRELVAAARSGSAK